ncbi:MAG TPA: hypothetical protein VLH75_18610 [Longimicrobiales bacterium]|nr:hypothetical protein [Longimicrobiales bacterium]
MPKPKPKPPAPSSEATQTVGRAIQRLAAARLGRGFVPLALLFLVGLAKLVWGSGGLVLALGAPLSAGAMLVYALRVVERSFGRPPGAWMSLAGPAWIVPVGFGVWVLGWLGLRGVAVGGGVIPVVSALLFTGLGVWVLRAWHRILELHSLAEAMIPIPTGKGSGKR